MAVENLKASAITNRDADPKVLSDSILLKGRLLEACGHVAASASASVGSTYRMVEVPSNARISQILLSSDDMGTTGDVDVGIYETTDNGGAVVDADFFGSAVDVNAAALSNSDVTHESGVFGIEDSEKPLWEALGLSEDPRKNYDIVLTITEAFTAGGDAVIKARFVI